MRFRRKPAENPLQLAFGIERSEEHTSELQHRCISYAVFCLKKKTWGMRRFKPRWSTFISLHKISGSNMLARLLSSLGPHRRSSHETPTFSAPHTPADQVLRPS